MPPCKLNPMTNRRYPHRIGKSGICYDCKLDINDMKRTAAK